MTAPPAGQGGSPGPGPKIDFASLDRLEARALLQDLVTRYCMAVDDRDLETIVGLFVPDGSFGHHGTEPAVGHQAIRAHYRRQLSAIPYSVHVADSQLITDLGPDHAAGVVNAHAEMGRLARPPLRAAMRYVDRYRLSEGSWRFESRRLHFWYFAPADKLDAGFSTGQRIQWPGAPRPADLPDRLATFAAFEAEVARAEREAEKTDPEAPAEKGDGPRG